MLEEGILITGGNKRESAELRLTRIAEPFEQRSQAGMCQDMGREMERVDKDIEVWCSG